MKRFNFDPNSESVYTKIYTQHVHSEQAHWEIQHCTIKISQQDSDTFPTTETKYFRDKHFLDMLLKNTRVLLQDNVIKHPFDYQTSSEADRWTVLLGNMSQVSRRHLNWGCSSVTLQVVPGTAGLVHTSSRCSNRTPHGVHPLRKCSHLCNRSSSHVLCFQCGRTW